MKMCPGARFPIEIGNIFGKLIIIPTCTSFQDRNSKLASREFQTFARKLEAKLNNNHLECPKSENVTVFDSFKAALRPLRSQLTIY